MYVSCLYQHSESSASGPHTTAGSKQNHIFMLSTLWGPLQTVQIILMLEFFQQNID